MAERRMFAKSIVLSDAFLDMPMSARCLYFTLSMFADDDGFVGSPKAIMRQCGASNDDIGVLLQKRFILGFDSGVIVIKHWRINNYLQSDRKKQTNYLEELRTLSLDENNSYTEKPTDECIQDVSKMYTQYSIGKVSIDKVSIDECSRGKCDCDSDTVEKPVENSKLTVLGGTLGRGLVHLTKDQMENLIDLMGVEMFDIYITKIADFIEQKGAKIHNHYSTILKWYREDSDSEAHD